MLLSMSKAVDLEGDAMLGVSQVKVALHAVMSRVNPHKQRENCTAAALSEACRKTFPSCALPRGILQRKTKARAHQMLV